MKLTPDNFQEAQKICINAVLEAMLTLTPNAYIGGEGSQDGIYVAGTDTDDNILYISHFDWEEVEEILESIEQSSVREWIIEHNR